MPESLSEVECRVYERQPCDVPTACRPAAAFNNREAQWSGIIRDISVGGIRLELRRRFEAGTGLAIEIPAIGDAEAYTVLAKVVHVRPLEGGAWGLGCKFISELSENELERLLAAMQPQEVAEAVVADGPRVLAEVRLQLTTPHGAVLDCVAHRLNVTAAWPLPEGKIVALRGGSADERWSLPVQVVACVEDEGTWTLECRLARTPAAADVLRAFAGL